MFELRGYIDETGKKRFAKWFEGLDAIDAAKVTIALTRIEQGNQAHIKGVGKGPSNTRLISGRVTASILAGTASAL
jgi:putative component of toxin-antitoxin plasmid stabilization module